MKRLMLFIVCLCFAGAAFAQTAEEKNLSEKWNKYEAILNEEAHKKKIGAFGHIPDASFYSELSELKKYILTTWSEFNTMKSEAGFWDIRTKNNITEILNACNNMLSLQVETTYLEIDTYFPADNKIERFRWLKATNAGMAVIVAENAYLKAKGKDKLDIARRVNKQLDRLYYGDKLAKPSLPKNMLNSGKLAAKEERSRELNLALTGDNNNESLKNAAGSFNAI